MAPDSGILFETGPICPFSIEFGPNGIREIRLLAKGLPPVLTSGEAPGGGGFSGVDREAAVPYAAADLAERLVRLMEGHPQDMADIVLDYSGIGGFPRKVYEELRKVPSGRTVTYGELAERVGRPQGARAVARAMATNRWPLVVPCHRVVGQGGKLTGFSGGHGLSTKARLLAAEGVLLPLPPGCPLEASLFEPHAWVVATATLAARDSRLARVIRSVGDVRLSCESPGSPFAALAEAVCYQQLAGSAAAAIFRKVTAALGGEVSPTSVLAAGESKLRGAGLSGSKTATLLELADRSRAGGLDLEGLAGLPYADLLEALTEVKGVGPWTVQMFAIFHLGHPDVFPPSDLGIRKAVTRLAGTRASAAAGAAPGPERQRRVAARRQPQTGHDTLLSAQDVASIAERWAPLRTVATWYLWRSLGTVMIG